MAIDFQPEGNTNLDFQPEPNQDSGLLSPTPLDTSRGIGPNYQAYMGNVGKDIASQGLGIADTASKLAFPMSNLPSYHDIKSYPDTMKSMEENVVNAIQHPIQTAFKKPISTLMALAGGVQFADEVPNLLPENVRSQIPDMVQKSTSLPERATELGGAHEPIPTDADIQTALQNVQKTVAKVTKEHGDLLNTAKSNAGLPVTEAEKDASILRYGNTSGLDLSKPLDLPPNLKQMAPTMEEGMAGPISSEGMQAYLKGTMGGGTNPNTGQPIPKVNIWGVRGDPNTLQAHFNDPNPASVPEDVLKAHGIQLPGQTSLTNMPYKLSDISSPEKLNTETIRFLSNQEYIDPADRIKMADYLQKRINDNVDWSKPGTETEGLLKLKYNSLKDVLTQNSPEIQAAKTKWASLQDNLNDISDKISGKSGDAESYLRKLFTSKDPATKVDREALTRIDQLAGTNTLETLFKKFAGEAYGKILGQSSHTIFQAPYSVLTSPRYVISPLTKVAKAAGIGAQTGMGAAGTGFTMNQMNPTNGSELQSVRDRILNANNQ